MSGGYGSSRAGFGETDQGFGFGGYKDSSQPVVISNDLPLPPIYGPLRQLLNTAPPGHAFDQQPMRQSVRISQCTGASTRVAISAGPGSDSVVPFSLFNQMLSRMERLEKENELLMRVVHELNDVIEKERGNELKIYEHPEIATATADSPLSVREELLSEEAKELPPWRIRK